MAHIGTPDVTTIFFAPGFLAAAASVQQVRCRLHVVCDRLGEPGMDLHRVVFHSLAESDQVVLATRWSFVGSYPAAFGLKAG